MGMQSYHVAFEVAADHRGEVQKNVSELFGLWKKYAGECGWYDTGNCELLFSYDKDSGKFSFDSGGVRDIPVWMMDDTYSLLSEIGKFASCPTVVRRTTDGQPTDFVVGKGNISKIIRQDKISKAAELLAEIVTDLDSDLALEANKLIAALQALSACQLKN